MEMLISVAAERVLTIQFNYSTLSSGFEDLDAVDTDNIDNTINRAIDVLSKRKIETSPNKLDTFYFYIDIHSY